MMVPVNEVMSDDAARRSFHFPATSTVPDVSEHDLWLAELSMVSGSSSAVRHAQFIVRTAVRAQALAAQSGTDPVDELLDARARTENGKSRTIYDRAIRYLRAEQVAQQLFRESGLAF